MKSMRNLLGVIVILMATTALWSTDFDLDYAVFRGSDNDDIVEVYLLIPRNLFQFSPEGEGYQSNGYARIAFTSNDTVRGMQEWNIVDRVTQLAEITESQKIPDIVTFSMPEGKYKIIALVMDLILKKTYRQEIDVNLRAFPNQSVCLSDINLSSNVSKTNTQNKFSKYFGYDVIPNAGNLYGAQHPVIFGYCELYNLSFDPSKVGNYQVKYSVTDLNKNEKVSQGWKTKKKPGTSAVEIGSISIQNLPSGLYNFIISARDLDTDQTADISKRFYIVKDDLRDLQSLALADDFDNLNEEQLDEAFGPLKYMANDTEIRSFRKSDLTGKRTILRKFWSQRDPDPTTPINEARVKFEQLLQNVNDQFSNSRQKGWKTDMGRIYLVYGPPSEIERHASSLESKPYQIWHYYEIEGGIIFVFVDKTGFGQMELVHSTGRNELQDYQWERWVSPSPSSSSSFDSY